MTRKFPALAAALLLACSTAAMQPSLAGKAETEARLDALERKLDSRGLLDMLNRLDQLQGDLQRLHGDLEMQTHTLDDMQRRQRELYMDIDRRLQQLESRPAAGYTPQPATGGLPGMPPATGAPPVAPAAAGGTPVMPATTGGTPIAPPPLTPAVKPPAATASAGEKADYDAALAILRDGRYTDAAPAFKKFLASYPGSQYADNASYWLGETYYVTREFDAALGVFNQLALNHPNSPKLPDSRLKTGFIHYELKDWKAARQSLTGVVETWPGSTAARLADERLQRMKKEGH